MQTVEHMSKWHVNNSTQHKTKIILATLKNIVKISGAECAENTICYGGREGQKFIRCDKTKEFHEESNPTVFLQELYSRTTIFYQNIPIGHADWLHYLSLSLRLTPSWCLLSL